MLTPQELARRARARRKEDLLARRARQVNHGNRNEPATVTPVSCVTNGEYPWFELQIYINVFIF